MGKSRFLQEYIRERTRDPSLVCKSANAHGDSLDNYNPTTLELYRAKFMVNTTEYSLNITDVTGSHDEHVYYMLRNKFYELQRVGCKAESDRSSFLLTCFTIL